MPALPTTSSFLHSDCVVQATFTSHLDYRNSPMGLPASSVCLPQYILNTAARESSKMNIGSGLSPASNFPVVSHLIQDKNLNKTQSLLPPTCFSLLVASLTLLQPYQLCWVSQTHQAWACLRAFALGVSAWNALPSDTCMAPSFLHLGLPSMSPSQRGLP